MPHYSKGSSTYSSPYKDSPSHILKIRGFDDDVSTGTVTRCLERERCRHRNVSLSQEKCYGITKNVAYIEMHSEEDARRFVKDCKGEVEMRGDLYRLYYHHEDPHEEPTNTILMRNVNSAITEADVCEVLNGQQLHYLDVRIIKNKHTGISRGFGFVDFASMEEAKKWMESQKGRLMVKNFELKLNYSSCHYDPTSLSSSYRSDTGGPSSVSSRVTSKTPSVDADWVCSRCSSHNFRRRDVCFTCQLPRAHSKSLASSEDGLELVGTAPCNTLIVRGLDAHTQETDLIGIFSINCGVRARQAHVMRFEESNLSKGFAFIEFLNVADAYKVMQEIKNKQFFEISGKAVQVDYSKNNFTTIMSTLRSEGSVNAKLYDERSEIQQLQSTSHTNAMAIAESALLRHHNNSKVSSAISQAIKTQPVAPSLTPAPTMPFNPATSHLVTYPFPDTTKFIYNEPTKFYYDPYTGLLYDPTSKYFFDRQSRTYFYFEQSRYQYIPVTSLQAPAAPTMAPQPPPPGIPPPPSGNEMPPPPPTTDQPQPTTPLTQKEEVKKKEKDKKARQIAKDMEKWAKRMNSMKDTPVNNSSKNSVEAQRSSKTADMAFEMLESKVLKATTPKVASIFTQDDEEEETQVTAQDDGPSSNTQDPEILVAEEEKSLTDWTKLACLLCSRGFKDAATLTKHINTSSLHLENLNKLREKYQLLPLSSLQEKESHSVDSLLKLGAQQAVGHDAATRKLGKINPKNNSAYRDRALERRMRFGIGTPETVPSNNPVEAIASTSPLASMSPGMMVPPSPVPIQANVGSKLLAKMGWEEGQGLGRANQGRTDVIEPEFREMGVGLGVENSRKHAYPGDDYKANVKKSMYARYNSVK